MDTSNLNQQLLEAVPALRPSYNQLRDGLYDGEEPSSYVVFGDILVPYLLAIWSTQEASSHEQSLRRVFEFLERMSAHPMHSDVVVSEVLPRILNPDEAASRLLIDFMGPETLQLAKVVASDFKEAYRERALKQLSHRETD